MMEITGKTSLYCILADPIAQVRTPQLVNQLLRQQGTDGVMVPVHVPPQHLADMTQALRQTRNFKGMVVTVPHKMAMLELCDDVEGYAAEIGAVNVVRREPDGRLVGAMPMDWAFCGGCASEVRPSRARGSIWLVPAGLRARLPMRWRGPG